MLLPFRPRSKRDDDPLVTISTFDVSGGMLTDALPAKIEDKYLSNCKNVYIKENRICQRFGYTAFGNNLPLDSSVVGIFHVFTYTGSSYLLAFTTEKVYKYNTATEDWDDITDTAEDYSGSIDEPFSLDVIYDDNAGELKYISTNRVNNIKKWTGSGNFDDLGGSPNKCVFLKNFNHYLMLFDVTVGATRYPQRVDWSDQGLPETWSGGSSGNNNLVKTPDFIIGAEVIRSQLAIYKEESITMCTYVGGANPFAFEENKIKGIGLKARETLCSLGDKHIFLSNKLDVKIFDGFNCYSVMKNKVYNKFIDNIDPDKVSRSHAHLIEQFNLYLLFVPKTGSEYPNSIWVYDYVKDRWTYWEFAAEMITSGYYLSSGFLTIGELTNKIKTLNWKIGSGSIGEAFPFSLFGDEDGYIYQCDSTQINDNDVAIEAEIETKSYVPFGTGRFGLHSSFGVYGKGDSVEVYLSKDEGRNYTKQKDIVLNKDTVGFGICRGIKTVSERVMYKIRNAVLNTSFELEGWVLNSLKRGKKVTSTYLDYLYDNDEERIVTEDADGKQDFVYIRS